MQIHTPSLFILSYLISSITGQGTHCPLECFHNGKCAYHDQTSQFYCTCPRLEDGSGGFQGIRCEEPFVHCTTANNGGTNNWRCHNHGQCNLKSMGCDCPPEFDDGKFCKIYSGPCDTGNGEFLVGSECMPLYHPSSAGRKHLSGGEIVGITLFALACAAFCFIMGLKFERRRCKAEMLSRSSGKPTDDEVLQDQEQQVGSHSI
mmetsp:Transcript_8784/g.10192  ORF Transcript_8784/g.10192 Transcript_8784/m.10192 type:complete len:204 (+) Transcript_8784:73-684(+)